MSSQLHRDARPPTLDPSVGPLTVLQWLVEPSPAIQLAGKPINFAMREIKNRGKLVPILCTLFFADRPFALSH